MAIMGSCLQVSPECYRLMSERVSLFEKWFQEIGRGSEGQSASLVVRVGIVQVIYPECCAGKDGSNCSLMRTRHTAFLVMKSTG